MQQCDPKAIRARREAVGKSREQTAVAVQRSYTAVQGYESGKVTPPLDVLCALADFYGCDVSDFFTAAERLVGQAEAQGFDREVTDSSVIVRAADLVRTSDRKSG